MTTAAGIEPPVVGIRESRHTTPTHSHAAHGEVPSASRLTATSPTHTRGLRSASLHGLPRVERSRGRGPALRRRREEQMRTEPPTVTTGRRALSKTLTKVSLSGHARLVVEAGRRPAASTRPRLIGLSTFPRCLPRREKRSALLAQVARQEVILEEGLADAVHQEVDEREAIVRRLLERSRPRTRHPATRPARSVWLVQAARDPTRCRPAARHGTARLRARSTSG